MAGTSAPGQGLELRSQAGLVVLDGEHVVGAPGDDPLGGVVLGERCASAVTTAPVRSWGASRSEGGDLTGLVGHALLGHHRPGALVQGRQKVRRRPTTTVGIVIVVVLGFGAAHGLTVHGDHPASAYGAGAGEHPRRHPCVQVAWVQGLQGAADSRLRGDVSSLW